MKKRNKWLSNHEKRRTEACLAKKYSTPRQRYNIISRLPKVGDTPVHYEVPDCIMMLFYNIEKLSKEMFSTINMNSLNEGYMDQYISAICELGISNDVEKQKSEHKRSCLSIREELECQRKLLEKEWENCKAAYEANRKELEANEGKKGKISAEYGA